MEDSLSELASNIEGSQLVVPCTELDKTLPFFLKELGFRLDQIFPADNPSVAVVSGYGATLRLTRGAQGEPGTLRLLYNDPSAFPGNSETLTAPNGMRIEFIEAHPPLVMPPTKHQFMVRKLTDSDPWVIGRAGMQYRDLVPDRLGGSMIASHIRVPVKGPVPDNVHFHIVGFQMIYCYRGWVRLVYEDQGEPFILAAGDCVLQPPQIRHRVLESSGTLEVIEIGCPAEHITTLDHDMDLPTGRLDPDKDFHGQIFCRHEVADAIWEPWRIAGFEARDTGIGKATAGVASVKVVRPANASDGPAETPWTSLDGDIYFCFVLEGSLTLEGEGHELRNLKMGDAFVIPPHLKTRLSNCSADMELLEVTLPAEFKTTVHD
ncbi:MAG: cupin domain-containing protein [Salaquimonas sp.]|nr:cupin domain-containing protein [Salaquimonas sp.]